MKLSVPLLVGITWLLATTVDVLQCDCIHEKPGDRPPLCTEFLNLKEQSSRTNSKIARQEILYKFDCLIWKNDTYWQNFNQIEQTIKSSSELHETFEEQFSAYCNGIYSEDTFFSLIVNILDTYTVYDTDTQSAFHIDINMDDYRYLRSGGFLQIPEDRRKYCGVQFIEKNIYDMDRLFDATVDQAYDMALLSYLAIKQPEIRDKLLSNGKLNKQNIKKHQAQRCFIDKYYLSDLWSFPHSTPNSDSCITPCSMFLFDIYDLEENHKIKNTVGQQKQIIESLNCLWPRNDDILEFGNRIIYVSNLFESFENKLYENCNHNTLDDDLINSIKTYSETFSVYDESVNMSRFNDYIQFTTNSSNPFSKDIFVEIWHLLRENGVEDRMVYCNIYENPRDDIIALYNTAMTQMYKMVSFAYGMLVYDPIRWEWNSNAKLGEIARRIGPYLHQNPYYGREFQNSEYLRSTFEIAQKNLESSIQITQ